MKLLRVILTAVVLVALALPVCAEDKPNPGVQQLAQAKQLFEQFMKLENNADPALADLYSDKAKIVKSVRYDDGMTRVWGAPAPDYKEEIRKKMAIPGGQGNGNAYTNVEYVVEGNNVRIKTMCLAGLTKISNPISLVVGPDDNGKWLILEMMIQTEEKGSHALVPGKPFVPPTK